MKRFNTWNVSYAADFWQEKFKPKNLIRTTSHANSVLSHSDDSRLIERYDINDLDMHTLGTAYIWVPIELDEPEYAGDDAVYPWVYSVDNNWLVIDAIYDKHVDPSINLQNGIDYVYKERSGKIECSKKILDKDGHTPSRLYISKGWYSEYRIYNEIGVLLDYVDKDSDSYRNSIMPILAALYKGPTYFHLLAILNVMIGLPVAKFGDETVTSIKDGIVKTDKYTYVIGNVHTTLKRGDKLFRFQPLTDAVELNTHEQRPYWWVSHPPDLFQKYVTDSLITNELRDYLMEHFLHHSVAGAEFRQDRLGTHLISINTAIQNLFLKAAPTKSDFIFTQSYHVGTSYDIYDSLIAPKIDKISIKLNILSTYGRYYYDLGEDGQFAIAANLIPRPTVDGVETFLNGKSLTFNDGVWHLYNTKDSFFEFWRFYNKITGKYDILVEPFRDYVYLRLTEEPTYVDSMYVRIPASLPDEHKPTVFMEEGTPNKDSLFLKVNSPSGYFSNISTAGEISNSVFGSNMIPANTLYGLTDFDDDNWEKVNLAYVADGVTVANDASLPEIDRYRGYIISKKINVGNISKNIIPTFDAVIPYGGILYMEFSKDREHWMQIENKTELKDITGNIYFKINLINNITVLNANPILKSLRITINKGE